MPPELRTALGFIFAPLVGIIFGAAIWCWDRGARNPNDIATVLFAFFAFGYMFALALGVPAYFWIRKQIALTPLACSIIGGIVAVTPVLTTDDKFLKLTVFAAGVTSGLSFWIIARFRRETDS